MLTSFNPRWWGGPQVLLLAAGIVCTCSCPGRSLLTPGAVEAVLQRTSMHLLSSSSSLRVVYPDICVCLHRSRMHQIQTQKYIECDNPKSIHTLYISLYLNYVNIYEWKTTTTQHLAIDSPKNASPVWWETRLHRAVGYHLSISGLTCWLQVNMQETDELPFDFH